MCVCVRARVRVFMLGCLVRETKNSDAFVAKLTHLRLCPYSCTDSTKQKEKVLEKKTGRAIKDKLKTYRPHR